MFLEFKAEYIQEYDILGHYYVSNGELNGLLVILSNTESGEVKDFFLAKDYLNDMYLWEKAKKEDVEFCSYGIEKGKTTKLVIETGFVKTKKKFSKDQFVSQPAKKYRFMLQAIK